MKLTTMFPVVCALVLAQQASAQTTCDTVAVGTPIYIGGSSALRPFVQTVGPKIAAQAGSPYTLFYYGGGSCLGALNVINPAANAIAPALNYYENNPDGGATLAKTCNIPPLADGGIRPLDVAISDVFVETCTSAARPADIGDFLGPAQAMVFAVPATSTQSAITAEEAYIAVGFGGVGAGTQAPPWNVSPGSASTPGNFYFRGNGSGTKLILGAAIGVPVTRWTGTQQANAQAVYDGLKNATGTAAIEASLGILGLDLLDQKGTDGTPNRDKVKELALAAYGQKYAFYPDSTKSSYDKRNLREGRYAGLGYAHFITPIKVDGTPVQDKVKYLIDLLTGGTVTPAPSFDVAKTIAGDAHLVPLCAMKVKRDAEGGDIKAYTPAASCGCYFESLNGTPPASCVQCPGGTCASGTCRNGWCESP